MNNQEVLLNKKNILLSLTKRQIKDAIGLIKSFTLYVQNNLFTDRINELETNYKYMLHYQMEGIEDPEQKNVYNGIIRSLFELTDDITDELEIKTSPNIYYEKIRIGNLRAPISLPEYQSQLKDLYDSQALAELLDENLRAGKQKEIAVKIERLASDMFTSIYISKRTDEQDYNNLLSFINSIDIKEREKCLLISAITLSLFHRFDAKKIQFLMSIGTHENIMISQRAIVGLIITLHMYDIRWEFYPECQHQLEILAENSYFKKSVLTIIKQLIRSRETEKISKKLTEEIIPEMMKFNSLAGKKLNMDELMGMTEDFSEKNPEWKKELENSGLADKLQEYSNLQMEGADVFHSTFASLKVFPFFYELSNWFLPFDPSYSELMDTFGGSNKDNLLYSAIVSSGHMCDSDKYSFCLSVLQMPEMQRNMMLQKFGSESEEIKQLQKETRELNPQLDEEIISNQYIQDLYRFFKLYKSKNDFFDIFRLKINFYSKKSISPLISETSDIKQIAQYCFDKNFFYEALEAYEILINRESTEVDVWQKAGYCYQMLGNSQKALEAYLRADLLSPSNSWTMKRIAQLYRAQKDYKLALSYYLKLQSLSPDNIINELNIGHCYLDLKEYDKALNSYFKVELLDGGDNPKAWRPIAWTAFLEKKYDLAQNYYQRILNNKPTLHDYLNAGHVELALNNRKKAMDYYLQTLKMQTNDIEKFKTLFLADKADLLEAGIEKDFFPLLFDNINYKLNS